MLTKIFIPAFNCKFHVAKGGVLTIVPTMKFTPGDLIQTYKMAKLHAKRKKLRKVETINDIKKMMRVPTLTS